VVSSGRQSMVLCKWGKSNNGSAHTDSRITNKTHCPGRGTSKASQFVSTIAESFHGGIWFKMQSTAAEGPSQPSHERRGACKSLLEFRIVEPILWQRFIPHVVWSQICRRGTSTPTG
jgi:hypothetical protein